jgi:hypothetical protein
MTKTAIALISILIGILLAGCADIAANNQNIDISGQVTYEYTKSL